MEHASNVPAPGGASLVCGLRLTIRVGCAERICGEGAAFLPGTRSQQLEWLPRATMTTDGLIPSSDSRKITMAKKKAGKQAVKAIEKAVKKAMHKGVTTNSVERAVDRAIDKETAHKAADKKDRKKTKSGKAEKNATGGKQQPATTETK